MGNILGVGHCLWTGNSLDEILLINGKQKYRTMINERTRERENEQTSERTKGRANEQTIFAKNRGIIGRFAVAVTVISFSCLRQKRGIEIWRKSSFQYEEALRDAGNKCEPNFEKKLGTKVCHC